MSEKEVEKMTREVLGSDQSDIAKAVILMSMSIDKLAEAITVNKTETDKKFHKLKIIMFFSENPKFLYLSIAGVIFLMIFSGIGDIIKLLK